MVTGATPIVHWIVDYDISTGNPNGRRAFYREIARLKKEFELHGKMSTDSVVFTSDRELAYEIFSIACRYAKRANLYRAILEASKGEGHR